MKYRFGGTRSELAQLIDEWIFSKRNREIVSRVWLDGITYEAAAEEFSLSTRQIGNIVSQCRSIVNTHLDA